MEPIQVDVRDSNIFSRGSWSSYDTNAVFGQQGTMSHATNEGATKVLRFVGTSIHVFGGLLPPSSNDEVLFVQFSLDGGAPEFFVPDVGYNPSPSVRYFRTGFGALPMEEHVLTITLVSQGAHCLLSYAVIRSDFATSAPQLLPSDGSPLPRGRSPPANTLPSPSSTLQQSRSATVSSSRTDTSSRSSSSISGSIPISTSTSLPSSTSSISSNSTSIPASLSGPSSPFQSTTNSASLFSAAGLQPTTVSSDNAASSATSVNRQPIIIGVTVSLVGFVLGILCGLLLWFLRKRKKQRMEAKAGNYPNPFSTSASGEGAGSEGASVSDTPPAYAPKGSPNAQAPTVVSEKRPVEA